MMETLKSFPKFFTSAFQRRRWIRFLTGLSSILLVLTLMSESAAIYWWNGLTAAASADRTLALSLVLKDVHQCQDAQRKSSDRTAPSASIGLEQSALLRNQAQCFIDRASLSNPFADFYFSWALNDLITARAIDATLGTPPDPHQDSVTQTLVERIRLEHRDAVDLNQQRLDAMALAFYQHRDDLGSMTFRLESVFLTDAPYTWWQRWMHPTILMALVHPTWDFSSRVDQALWAMDHPAQMQPYNNVVARESFNMALQMAIAPDVLLKNPWRNLLRDAAYRRAFSAPFDGH